MEVEVVLSDIPAFDPSPAFLPATLEDLVEAEVVIADIPALDPSPDLIPAAEPVAFPAYDSTVLSTLSVGPSFAVAVASPLASAAVILLIFVRC